MARLDTFEDPSQAGPVHPIGAEIEMLRGQFVALGVNPDHAVPLWLGKPDRFTGVVMTSAQQVLSFFHAELAAQRAARGEAAPGAPVPVHNPHPWQRAVPAGDDPQPALVQVAPSRAPRRSAELVDQIKGANAAWREAVRLRAEAMRQWDAYVESSRREFHRLRDMR